MGKKRDFAIQVLKDLHGEDRVRVTGNVVQVEGEGVSTLLNKPNVKHVMAAELNALGYTKTKTEHMLKRDKTKGNSGYYGRVLKNHMVKDIQTDLVAEAKAKATERLNRVVVQAAENIAQAVEGGHLPSSLKVLQMADVINPVQKKEVAHKVSFASWLSEAHDTKLLVEEAEYTEIEREELETLDDEIITDIDELSDETGNRIDIPFGED